MTGGGALAGLVIAGLVAGRGHPYVGLVLGVLVMIGGWLASSWFYPWRTCWRCKGSPKNSDSRGHHNRWCPVCGGRGSVRRWGSRLLGGGFGDL